VVELCQRLRLAAKTPQPFGIVRHLGGQNFEGYITAEFGIGSAIHLAHAASTERRLDFIRTEF
jgi:hypothetical protein